MGFRTALQWLFLCVLSILTSACTHSAGLLFVAEQIDAYPSGTAYLQAKISVGGYTHDPVLFTVPTPSSKPLPHRFGVRLPDNASGEVSITLTALDSNKNALTVCGNEYQWQTTAELN